MAKYFKESEFTCKCGCGKNNISQELVTRLDAAREEAGVPFVVTSGCRCEKRNKEAGGVAGSSHLKGMAVDIATPPARIYFILKALLNNFNRHGIPCDNNFVHVGIDPEKPQNVVFKY